MNDDEILNILNSKFQMIGLSADWIYQTWLIKGDRKHGVVIFENEDNTMFEIIEFHYGDDDRVERNIYTGALKDVIEYSSCLK